MNELNSFQGLKTYMNDKPSALCITHIGKRLVHEDNFLFNCHYLTPNEQKKITDSNCHFWYSAKSTRVRLFAISDGMGGHKAGKIASRICVENLAAAETILHRYNSIKEAVAYLQTVIANINDVVCDLSHKNDELNGMGATLVLFVTLGVDCAILNIGDSRAYQLINRELIQITKDHTEGQRMLDLGLLTRKELSDFPDRKNLSRYIGYGQHGYILQADEYYPVIEDGLILLCSDGITDFVTNEQIQEILRSESNIEMAGKRLIDKAVAAPNADNTTLILISLRR